MVMKKVLAVAVALVGVTTGMKNVMAAGNQGERSKYKGAEASKAAYEVIFHVDSEDLSAMKKTLGNINNLLKDPRLQGKVQIELLANSLGYKIFEKGNGLEQSLEALAQHGVILAQCGNTLKEQHVDPSKIYDFVGIVPSGVGELTIREGEGWAYIHPSM